MKHPHKGSKSKIESLRNVPFVEMTTAELDACFRAMAADGDRDQMKKMRANPQPDGLVIALILKLADGSERVLLEQFEYGDGEGRRFIHFERASFRKLLLPGESLECRAYSVWWAAVLQSRT